MLFNFMVRVNRGEEGVGTRPVNFFRVSGNEMGLPHQYGHSPSVITRKFEFFYRTSELWSPRKSSISAKESPKLFSWTLINLDGSSLTIWLFKLRLNRRIPSIHCKLRSMMLLLTRASKETRPPDFFVGRVLGWIDPNGFAIHTQSPPDGEVV